MKKCEYCRMHKVIWLSDIGTRQNGAGSGILPSEINEPTHLWAFFSNEQNSLKPSQDNISDSVYLGKF